MAESQPHQPDLNNEDEPSKPWADSDTLFAVETAVRTGGLPARSLALYARWWQLETWLRELAYVELRACYGALWADQVKAATGRQSQDAAFTHMLGADNENPLAYLDYSKLVEVIGNNWNLFEYALIERRSWDGRQEELKRIRHRIAHMRRPHDDDLSRIEQTLRDLERGTFIALASYNKRFPPNGDKHSDPVTRGWILDEHPIARQLVQHAERQYETRLLVHTSRRPWATWPSSFERAEGVLWHVGFYMRARSINLRRLWNDGAVVVVRPLLVHVLSDNPWGVEFTFAAADDPNEISDAIGDIFEAVLGNSQYNNATDDFKARQDRWIRNSSNVDYRVLTNTGWNIVSESTVPISAFGAGGGVTSAPGW
ncbi:hypothetical protein Franean1_2654 [Parafrankia sp. EAN1pec]|uniref:Swt1 family HEPN domain-containing protein n=1 Tax=Parafrankia sp. (strain EAN1pec) TaxID=298653 RepID=UPI0000544D6F|nr:hypothetical protein Franean1_2654 [Frankia sp. EAN1pec]